MEYNEINCETSEVLTELDRNADATVIDADDTTIQSHTQVIDADQPTLCAEAYSPEAVEEDLESDVPVTELVFRGPSIKRLFTGEEAMITKPVFCIGRKDDVEYAVSHNPAISRKHAEIISRNGRYYIRDLGAKNRTYVNGKLLPVKGESELSNGDVIKLANEDFLVRL